MSPTILDRLKTIAPTSFEQLTHDLLISVGFRNVLWRTPGADGGRDIEADHAFVDPTDEYTVERWYIECKRYSNAVDWPTVADKLAYAENHDADYLLLVTTSSPSPKCVDEIAIHNRRRIGPRIRVWAGHYLETLLDRYRVLLFKYDLATAGTNLSGEVLPLALHLSKICQATYAASAFAQQPVAGIEYAATLSELMTARVADVDAGRPFTAVPARPDRDIFDWVVVQSGATVTQFDAYGFRAALAAFRLVTGEATISLSQTGVDVTVGNQAPPSSLRSHLDLIGLWSNVGYTLTDGSRLNLHAQ